MPTTTTLPKCTDGQKAEVGSVTASWAPDRTLAAGQLPKGAAMQRILERGDGGRLIVGVDENTPYFGVRDERGQLEGLEIDLVREIARAIWPSDADHIDRRIQWQAVVTDEKVPFARDGKVDMTVSTVTMNCDRWQQVAFSTSYFTTPQRVLVLDASDIETLADLDGKTVCVTAGSSTIAEIQAKAPGAKPHEEEARTDCLVALQDGKVDAIATHDTILFGLRKQEGERGVPTRILDEPLSTSNYGIAMNHDDLSLVRYVNGVLEQMRADGRLTRLYDEWLTSNGYTPPPVPAAHYRDES